MGVKQERRTVFKAPSQPSKFYFYVEKNHNNIKSTFIIIFGLHLFHQKVSKNSTDTKKFKNPTQAISS